MLLTDQSPAFNCAVPGRTGPNVGVAAETRSAAASSSGTDVLFLSNLATSNVAPNTNLCDHSIGASRRHRTQRKIKSAVLHDSSLSELASLVTQLI